MIRYYIAKYVDDLTRNEPINVGVIVHSGADLIARFDGEDDNNKIDLRRVRNRVTGSHAYRAWVDYWRAVIESPEEASPELRGVPHGDSRIIEHLISASGRDFYLEHGGTVRLDAEDTMPQAMLEELFGRLVRQPDPPAPPSLREKSRDALKAAGAPLDDDARFKEQVPVQIELQGVKVEEEVSYAVMNGEWHYLQEMPFDPEQKRRSRKEASHCAFIFEHAAEVRDSGVILYDQSDVAAGQYQFLELLMKFAPTVNVSNTDEAAGKLQERLGLS